MTLSDKIQFVSDLIRENPDITIREYLEALQEIETIEKTREDLALAEELERIRRAPKPKPVEVLPAEYIYRGAFECRAVRVDGQIVRPGSWNKMLVEFGDTQLAVPIRLLKRINQTA